MGACCAYQKAKKGKTGGMRFKLRIKRIMKEFRKELKTMRT